MIKKESALIMEWSYLHDLIKNHAESWEFYEYTQKTITICEIIEDLVELYKEFTEYNEAEIDERKITYNELKTSKVYFETEEKAYKYLENDTGGDITVITIEEMAHKIYEAIKEE